MIMSGCSAEYLTKMASDFTNDQLCDVYNSPVSHNRKILEDEIEKRNLDCNRLLYKLRRDAQERAQRVN